MNALPPKRRTVKVCYRKPPLVSTLTDDFQASEAEILNKLKKVETNKSSTLRESSSAAWKESRTKNGTNGQFLILYPLSTRFTNVKHTPEPEVMHLMHRFECYVIMIYTMNSLQIEQFAYVSMQPMGDKKTTFPPLPGWLGLYCPGLSCLRVNLNLVMYLISALWQFFVYPTSSEPQGIFHVYYALHTQIDTCHGDSPTEQE